MDPALLTRFLDGQADVERAIGLLMERHDTSPAQALDLLVRCADRAQLDLADVARILIELS